jgi:hypothetical protein
MMTREDRLQLAEVFLAGDVIVGRQQLAIRQRLAAAVVKAFEMEIARRPGEKPSASVVKAIVKEELAGFIPFWLVTIFLGWIIHRLLDWLWQHHAEREEHEEKA